MKKSLFWILLTPLMAQDRLSLSDAVRLALHQNKAIAATAAGMRAAEARLGEARAGNLPKVNYSESFVRSGNPVFVFSSLLTQHQFGAENFNIGPLNRPDSLNNFQSVVTVDQPLYDAGQTRFESIDRLRDPSRLKSWVFRIAKNECFMKRRKSVFAPTKELSLDDLRPLKANNGEGHGIEIAGWTSLPEDLLRDKELQNALTRSIQELPEIYRSVVLLRDVEELTTEETAEILEISLDVVKTRLHRGRLALRQYMDLYLRTAKGGISHER